MAGKPHTLVVGGTRGIGRAVVRHFQALDHSVSVLGRRAIEESHLPGVHTFSVELADSGQVAQTVDSIIGERGPLSNVIFLQRFRGEGDDWKGELDVTLTATRNIIEQIRDGFDVPGSIVVVASNASHLVAAEQPVSYHMAKAALVQMARYYAVTLAPAGVRVNCVTPGAVMKNEALEYYRSNQSLVTLYNRITPMGRMGTSEDIAGAIGFLCSTQAAFITGQDIVVDGGLSLLWQESLARQIVSMSLENSSKPYNS